MMAQACGCLIPNCALIARQSPSAVHRLPIRYNPPDIQPVPDKKTNGEPEVLRRHAVMTATRRPLLGRLRRVLGTPALFSLAYADVGSSIYYALGIVAFYALGAAPVALFVAGLLFVLTGMTYAEGSSVLHESGGSASFARHGFRNDALSFLAGWQLLLVYIVTAALSALSAAHYLAQFWPAMERTPPAAAIGVAMLTVLAILNILSVRESARLSIALVITDLITQFFIVTLGFLFLFSLPTLLSYVDWTGLRGTWPTPKMFIYSIAIGMVGYVGLESIAQHGEESKEPARTIPRAIMMTVYVVLFMFTLIPVIAMSAVDPQTFKAEWTDNPVAAIVTHFPTTLDLSLGFVQVHLPLRVISEFWIAILAWTILFIAANAALMAGARLTRYMCQHRQLPGPMGATHPKLGTPVWGLIVFWAVAVLLLVPGLFGAKDLLVSIGTLYVFGSQCAFALAHAGLIGMRKRSPDTPRPFRSWPNVRFRGTLVPIAAVLGLLATTSVFIILYVSNRFTLIWGSVWVLAGVVLYVWYRKSSGLSLTALAPLAAGTHVVESEPESRAPTVRAMQKQIERLLVPVYDQDDVDMLIPYAAQFAKALTAKVRVLAVVEVPHALPLGAALPEQHHAAEALLQSAQALAEERYNLTVETELLQARSSGVAICEQAAREHSDIILLAVTRSLGSSGTIAYVEEHAPCPVWVLYPPGHA